LLIWQGVLLPCLPINGIVLKLNCWSVVPTPAYKFGDFELDSSRFELRRNGLPLKVERIPMELLILLLEKNGQVVSRQEIIERLWGKDVFHDTEHGINTAVRKIRKALREDVERPRFIQTVSGKGYRLVADEGSASESGSAASAKIPGTHPVPSNEVLTLASTEGEPIRTSEGPASRKGHWAVVAFLMAGATLVLNVAGLCLEPSSNRPYVTGVQK
jgi:DNA-binding winged helix-turn-helix (wHTH) protein